MTEALHDVAGLEDVEGTAVGVLDVLPLGLDAVAEEREVVLQVVHRRDVALQKVVQRPELLRRAHRPQASEPALILLQRDGLSRTVVVRLVDQPQHPLVAQGVRAGRISSRSGRSARGSLFSKLKEKHTNKQ